jgi:hypothetical protein
MNEAHAVTELTIEVTLGPDPVTGHLCAPDGPPRRFAGYLELVSLIEQLRHESQSEVR